MEENIYQIIKNQEINFLKEELDRIKKQIKDYKYKDSVLQTLQVYSRWN